MILKLFQSFRESLSESRVFICCCYYSYCHHLVGWLIWFAFVLFVAFSRKDTFIRLKEKAIKRMRLKLGIHLEAMILEQTQGIKDQKQEEGLCLSRRRKISFPESGYNSSGQNKKSEFYYKRSGKSLEYFLQQCDLCVHG